MNHYVKLICAASLSAMIFFSCSTHKDKEREIEREREIETSFPVSLSSSSSLSATPLSLSVNDLSLDSLLVVDATERERERKKEADCSPVGSQSCTDCSLVSSLSCTECSPVGSHSCLDCSSEHTEEYFNLPSPTVDTREYKTVCEGDNPPLRGGNQSVDISPIQQFSITDEEIEMLKYIVEQETRGGSYRHKCIVTNVVLNRVKDSRFPNTVREVLLQKNQFSSTWNYYQKRNKPDEKTENAVNNVLNGKERDESNGALYFHSMSSDGWFSSLSFIMEMEGHRFFK